MSARPRIPSYRRHKARDLAVVTLDGKDHYLGPYDSPESWEKYHRLIADHLANRGKPVLPSPVGEPLTIQRLCLAYSDFAETYYVKDGKPTAEVDCVTYALQRLIKLYGTTPAAEFGPKALKLVRDEYKLGDELLGVPCRNRRDLRFGLVARLRSPARAFRPQRRWVKRIVGRPDGKRPAQAARLDRRPGAHDGVEHYPVVLLMRPQYQMRIGRPALAASAGPDRKAAGSSRRKIRNVGARRIARRYHLGERIDVCQRKLKQGRDIRDDEFVQRFHRGAVTPTRHNYR